MSGRPRLRIVTVVGTRPELIRLSRVIPRLDTTFEHFLVHTGQNYDYELNQVFFDDLGLRAPDRYLGVDTTSLGAVLGGTLMGTEAVLRELQPDAVLVLGDTNSCIAALMAKRCQVPVYHMEAGNRCLDWNVPEETNRRLVDHIADFNLVYTEHARRNLLAEGLPSRRVYLTGSPMAEVLAHFRSRIDGSDVLSRMALEPRQYLVVSAHREETVDDPARLSELVSTLRRVGRHYGRRVLVSAHPRTRKRLASLDVGTEGLEMHKPFGFFDYVKLQRESFCVLSDSGTISEECSILGFPAVTLRESIERPEAIEAGGVITTGLDAGAVLQAIEMTVRQHDAGEVAEAPDDYRILNCSQRVVNIIRSTAHVHHEWAGIRRRRAEDGTLEQQPSGDRGA